MEAWSIVLTFFLGVFSHRIMSSVLNYTQSYSFLLYCFACCITMIRGFCRDAKEVRDMILEIAKESNADEEQIKVIENKFNRLFLEWEGTSFVRVNTVVPGVFKKALPSDKISGKLGEAFSEINK